MIYNINTALEINLMKHHEDALKALQTRNEQMIPAATVDAKPGVWRKGAVLRMILQLIGLGR